MLSDNKKCILRRQNTFKEMPSNFSMLTKRDAERGNNTLLRLHSYTYNMYNKLITCLTSSGKKDERRL